MTDHEVQICQFELVLELDSHVTQCAAAAAASGGRSNSIVDALVASLSSVLSQRPAGLRAERIALSREELVCTVSVLVTRRR